MALENAATEGYADIVNRFRHMGREKASSAVEDLYDRFRERSGNTPIVFDYEIQGRAHLEGVEERVSRGLKERGIEASLVEPEFINLEDYVPGSLEPDSLSLHYATKNNNILSIDVSVTQEVSSTKLRMGFVIEGISKQEFLDNYNLAMDAIYSAVNPTTQNNK